MRPVKLSDEHSCREDVLSCPVEGEDGYSRPPHYNRGKIEVIDFITDQGLDFIRGNIVKYAVRAGYKAGADEADDMEKIRVYVDLWFRTRRTGT